MVAVEPPWVSRGVVLATLASAVLAVLGYTTGLPYPEYATASTAIGGTYILYKWGQHPDRASKSDGDSTQRQREKEMDAEKGGQGGNF